MFQISQATDYDYDPAAAGFAENEHETTMNLAIVDKLINTKKRGGAYMSVQVDLSQHVFQNDTILIPAGSVFPAVTCSALGYSNLNTMSNFITSWWAVTEPFTMEHHTVWHDFDQLLFFCGGDLVNMTELGGKVEFYLGDEQGNLEKLLIAKPAVIYVKAGMHHCPLKFIEIDDPEKPILFQDITLSGVYSRFRAGSNVRLNAQDEPME